ncbi:MAG TPA: ABC transporter permease [bacterium]|jgi:peptide/nickel transport system permease protein|nr:ABC transporter permease [bacterium]
MQRFLVRRVLQAGVVLAGLSVVLFSLLVYTPGDPVELLVQSEPDVRPEDVAALRKYYGLDDPVYIRYFKWLRTLAGGDLGYSRTYRVPVIQIMGQRLGNTLLLVGTSFLIAFAVGVAVGIYSAMRQYSAADYGFTIVSFIGLAMPNFWQGIVMILLFAVWIPLFPAGGMITPGVARGWPLIVDRLWHLVLPASVLATSGMAAWTRYMRSSMLEVIRQDYVRTARAKGLAERRVINRHALRNALLPIITLIALSIPAVLNGAVLTETVFSWPGMGLLLFQAILGHDFNVAMAVLLFLAVATVLFNLMADIAYSFVDPRIRYG